MNSTNNEILPQGYKMTELGALPEEWEVVVFEKCIKKEASKVGKVKQQEYKVYGKYPIIDQGQSLIAGYCDNEKYVYEGRLPVIIFGDHTRILKFINFPFVTGADGTKVLTPNTSVILPEFFYFDLLNIKIPNRGYNRHYSLLREQKLPLPPLPEQQKIAAVLSAVQEAKEKTQAVIDATKALKKSMMKHLFTYGPVPPEETENVPLKESEIGKMPEDWEVVRLGEVAEITSGGTPSRKRNEYWINGNIPWIKSEQCHDCYISVANEYITDLGLKDSSAKMLKKGTVLLAMVGATIGKTGFLTFEACTNQNIAGIFPMKGLDNLFLYFALQSRYNEFYKIKGYAIANLSYLRQFSLPLPPLPVQQKIASILSAIDAKIEAEENKKQALEELFKTLLHNLMTAKIRVNNLEIKV